MTIEPENKLRADTYRLLGRLLGTPPDDATLSLLATAPISEEDNLLAVAWRLLATSAERAVASDVTSEYEALFIGLGRGELMPYASWYLTGYLMEQPLASLRSDMRELGFERRDNVSEPEDHAAALCEIMALLAAEDHACGLAQQANFFHTHIGTWLARFFRDMQEARSARFYRAVGQLGEQFIETDQRYLEMVQKPDGTEIERNRPGVS
ncbi:MAG: molecular chaperone [Woeseiaceae bacterium]|nr:molecular chaperone TorD family protein [Gammaproteobacteria bacterium]NNK24165.1 molecular chaperone [Woeseiaceae bacterium]